VLAREGDFNVKHGLHIAITLLLTVNYMKHAELLSTWMHLHATWQKHL
jgi:hypothetical protein